MECWHLPAVEFLPLLPSVIWFHDLSSTHRQGCQTLRCGVSAGAEVWRDCTASRCTQGCVLCRECGDSRVQCRCWLTCTSCHPRQTSPADIPSSSSQPAGAGAPVTVQLVPAVCRLPTELRSSPTHSQHLTAVECRDVIRQPCAIIRQPDLWFHDVMTVCSGQDRNSTASTGRTQCQWLTSSPCIEHSQPLHSDVMEYFPQPAGA